MYFVYLLYSFRDRKFYVGYTKNLKKRVSKHLLGEVMATRFRLPLQLIYYEAYIDKKDAKGREKFLKGGSGHKYLNKQLKNFLGNIKRYAT